MSKTFWNRERQEGYPTPFVVFGLALLVIILALSWWL